MQHYFNSSRNNGVTTISMQHGTQMSNISNNSSMLVDKQQQLDEQIEQTEKCLTELKSIKGRVESTLAAMERLQSTSAVDHHYESSQQDQKQQLIGRLTEYNHKLAECAAPLPGLVAALRKLVNSAAIQADSNSIASRGVAQKLLDNAAALMFDVKSLGPRVQSQCASRAHQSSGGGGGGDHYLIDMNESATGNEATTQQQQQYDTDIEAQIATNREIERLGRDVVQINEIFTNLATIIHDQSEIVDSIESHVEEAHQHTVRAETNLKKAVSHKRAVLKKKICCLSVLLIALLIIALIIWLSVRSNK